jgi:hypothetical protein
MDLNVLNIKKEVMKFKDVHKNSANKKKICANTSASNVNLQQT